MTMGIEEDNMLMAVWPDDEDYALDLHDLELSRYRV